MFFSGCSFKIMYIIFDEPIFENVSHYFFIENLNIHVKFTCFNNSCNSHCFDFHDAQQPMIVLLLHG